MRPTLGSYDSLIYMTDGKRVLAKEHIDTIQLFNWCDYSGKLTQTGRVTYRRLRQALDKAQKGGPYNRLKALTTPKEWANNQVWAHFSLDRTPVTTNKQIIYKGKPFADFILDSRKIARYYKQQTINVISQAIRADGLLCSPVYVQRASFSSPTLLWMHNNEKTIDVPLAKIYYDLIYTLFKGDLTWQYVSKMDCFLATTNWHQRTFGKGIIAIVAPCHVTGDIAKRYNFSPYGGIVGK